MGYRTLLAVAAMAAFSAADADAFWASRGSYGSYGSAGSYGSSGSFGSHGSYASRGSYGSHGSYASRGSYGSHGSYASRGSYGSTGSSGSYGSTGSSGSYGSHGSAGPFKRLAAHIRAKHASSGSHGSTGSTGSYGSHGSAGATVTYYHSSAGSHGSHGASYNSTGSAGSYGGAVYGHTTVHSGHVIASTNATTTTRVVAAKPVTGKADSGMLSVRVPTDAVVFVNGKKTTSTGSQRQYVSHGLQSGESYTYDVRVEVLRNGEKVSDSKSVKLVAGGNQSLDFSAIAGPTPAEPEQVAETEEDEEGVVTKLTLRVPEDAKVTLAGAVTQQTGAERQFLTDKLAAGATWEDYVVRVEATVDGASKVQQRRITLRGGESQSMVFSFGESSSAKLASLN
ncbi:MAG: TIGR03000 domain-containing protein [Planctomycetota bacterium]